jgi:hypothetical protein
MNQNPPEALHCKVEQAEQTAYWLYDNLLTLLLHLHRNEKRDMTTLVTKTKTMYQDLGTILNHIEI